MSSVSEPVPSYHPGVRVDRDGSVATVTLDRPETRNACTGGMWVALGRTFRDLGWSGVRAIVLTGANEHFCTGADLSGNEPGGGGGTQLDAMRVLGEAVMAIQGCPVPVIVKVDGLAVGAGFGLSLAGDLTYCSDRARFSAIFAKRGLSPDFGTSWFLRQRVGVHKAKEIVLTAKMLSGQEAFDLGLVNGVVPVSDLDTTVADVVATIADGPPMALSMAKRLLDNGSHSSLTQALEAEALAQNVNIHTDDMKEALTAWLEKRPAEFHGR